MSDTAAQALQELLCRQHPLPYGVQIDVWFYTDAKRLMVKAEPDRELTTEQIAVCNNVIAEMPDGFEHNGVVYDVGIELR